MSKHRDYLSIDLAQWPSANVDAMLEDDRAIYERREMAVRMYLSGGTIDSIETEWGIRRGQFYHLLRRCLEPHEDGRVQGFRGLAKYSRVQSYSRVAAVTKRRKSSHGGASGAFVQLLQAYPVLQEWINRQASNRIALLQQMPGDGPLRIRLNNFDRLHHQFLAECRNQGLTISDYPFNTQQQGCRTLSRMIKAEILRDFGDAARRSGATHLKGMPRACRGILDEFPQWALKDVEFDGHRLDLRLKIVVRDPLGFEQQFEIERLWLLVIIDVYSRAVLGYHVSLNPEYNRYDIIRTIEKSIEPHAPVKFSLPGLGYGERGGFPSMKLPELGYATWNRIKMDNAKANLSDDVAHSLAEFMGCFIDAGRPHTPNDRPYIERFFGTLSSQMSSRIPGYTGSSAKDLRRALSNPKTRFRLFVSLTELEELLEASLAAYNANPHDGLNGLTPLEAIEQSVRGQGRMLTWLPEHKRRSLCLMQTPKVSVVRGYLAQGRRPHVNFYKVIYTNASLAANTKLIGTKIRLYYNSQDLRTIRAMTMNGVDLGELKAQGAWGVVAHDLKLRQEILKRRNRKDLRQGHGYGFIETFVADKLAKAGKSRRAASSLARTLRALSDAPGGEGATPLPTAQKPKPVSAEAVPESNSIKPQFVEMPSQPVKLDGNKIKPQELTIGTGFVVEPV